MPRERDPKRDEAEKLWLDSDGKLDLIDIATRLEISPGTVRGWKSKDKWSDKLNGTFQTGKQRNAPKPERSKERKITLPNVVIENDGLTEKKQIFVMEYMRDFNATRAAMAAGYSKRSAYTEGWRLLKNADVQAEIKRMRDLLSDEMIIDIKRIIAEYMKIAFADITDYVNFGKEDMPLFNKKGIPLMNEDGTQLTQAVNFVDLKNDSEVDGTVISEVKQGKDGVSIKLHDKLRALEKLEKYVGYMTEEERLRLVKLRAEVSQINGDSNVEDKQDDGFMDALKGAAAEVWDDDEDSET